MIKHNEKHRLPPHLREGVEEEPTHSEIIEKLNEIEELVRNLERKI